MKDFLWSVWHGFSAGVTIAMLFEWTKMYIGIWQDDKRFRREAAPFLDEWRRKDLFK